jgi:Tfp pilus assembly protein PilE
MKKGFITLIGILIAVLILGIWFVKIYSSPTSSDKKTQIETYNSAIKDAENAKKMLEKKSDLDIENI